MTFINTFNALSIPKFKNFLEYILKLRTQYSKDNQGTKYIPIHDPYSTHNDYEIHPRQRIWFDIPILRNPAWQAIHILPKEFDHYLEEAIAFMKANANTDNFVGFYDFEIEKAERNLAALKARNLSSPEALERNRRNLVKYFDQHDARRGTNFCKID